MLTVHKKIVLDEKGKPTEVIIPWKKYKEIEELLGLDLDKKAIQDLMQARKDREKGKKDAYVELDSI
jgi:PHD/YefM family antitoxin component YafN of YafNO toxin-antitoxin module